jgi:hypothetical protein
MQSSSAMWGFQATGMPLRRAQTAMRHSDPSLTANVCTDPKLLDVAGAVASLPDLPLVSVGGQAGAMVGRLNPCHLQTQPTCR